MIFICEKQKLQEQIIENSVQNKTPEELKQKIYSQCQLHI